MSIHIADVNSNFEREPLVRPFGFKGSYVREIWQTVAGMRSASGRWAAALNTQSPLWSDADVFHPPNSVLPSGSLTYASSQ